MGPWVLFATIAVLAFFAIIWSRITLDRTAFELQELEGRIAAEQARYGELRLEVARLESPSRIAPLAEELGMVFPSGTETVAANGVKRTVGPPRRLTELKSILSASSP
jgi:cell division protein FtsL